MVILKVLGAIFTPFGWFWGICHFSDFRGILFVLRGFEDFFCIEVSR